jgi:hypothetical protein
MPSDENKVHKDLGPTNTELFGKGGYGVFIAYHKNLGKTVRKKLAQHRGHLTITVHMPDILRPSPRCDICDAHSVYAGVTNKQPNTLTVKKCQDGLYRCNSCLMRYALFIRMRVYKKASLT